METKEEYDLILNNIWMGRNRFFKSTNIKPTHITMHPSAYNKIKRQGEFIHPSREDVFGMKVLVSYEIKEDSFVIGIE